MHAERLRIELAPGGILDHAVLDAIQRVAGLSAAVVQSRVLRRRNVAGFVLVRRLPDEKLRRLDVRGVNVGIAGDDAVVIAGKSLRLRDRLPCRRWSIR